MGRYWTLGARLVMRLLLACGVSIGGRCGGPPAGRIAAAGQELGRWGHDGTLLGQAPDGLPVPCRSVPGPRRQKGRPQGVPRDGSTGPSGSEEERTGLAGAGVALGSEDAGSQPILGT